MKPETKQCQNCKQEFTIEPEDFDFYKKVDSPPPEWCFYCRSQNRLAFWPFGKFHKRTCDLTGERIVSIFSHDARFPVYKSTHWYSDKWEPPSAEYDTARSFFDQLYELQNETPRPHQFGTKNTNCDYSDDVWDCKNCYLCRSLLGCENISYCYRTIRCRDSYDLFYCYDTEQSYDCIYCFKVHRVRHAFDTRDSLDSAFLYDCRNLQNCFMCWNLRNKQYCIKNEQYSKEAYFEKLKEYNLGSWSEVEHLREEFNELVRRDAVHKTNFNVKTMRSRGNYLTECKSCRECYFLEVSENCAYVVRGLGNRDTYDSTGILRGELIYDVCQLSDGYQLKHSNYCTNCRESEYLDYCIDCEQCFGCVGLQKKKFCVLNRQYGEEEYHKLVAEIKEKMKQDREYGKFLPYRMAYVGYNLSLAGIMFPKSKEEIEKLGGLWEKLEEPEVSGLTLYGEVDDIADVGDGVVSKALVCKETGRAFNITKDELGFLRQHSIPLPHYYPDVRTMKRVARLFDISRYEATCHFCKKSITVHYPKEWNYEKVACVDCYRKEVI